MAERGIASVTKKAHFPKKSLPAKRGTREVIERIRVENTSTLLSPGDVKQQSVTQTFSDRIVWSKFRGVFDVDRFCSIRFKYRRALVPLSRYLSASAGASLSCNTTIFNIDNASILIFPPSHFSIMYPNRDNITSSNIQYDSAENLGWLLSTNIEYYDQLYKLSMLQATLKTLAYVSSDADVIYAYIFYFSYLEKFISLNMRVFNITRGKPPPDSIHLIPLFFNTKDSWEQIEHLRGLADTFSLEPQKALQSVYPEQFMHATLLADNDETKFIGMSSTYDYEHAKEAYHRGYIELCYGKLMYSPIAYHSVGAPKFQKLGTKNPSNSNGPVDLESYIDWALKNRVEVRHHGDPLVGALYDLVDHVSEGYGIETFNMDKLPAHVSWDLIKLKAYNLVNIKSKFWHDRITHTKNTLTRDQAREFVNSVVGPDNYKFIDDKLKSNPIFWSAYRYYVAKKSVVNQLYFILKGNNLYSSDDSNRVDPFDLVYEYLCLSVSMEPTSLWETLMGSAGAAFAKGAKSQFTEEIDTVDEIKKELQALRQVTDEVRDSNLYRTVITPMQDDPTGTANIVDAMLKSFDGIMISSFTHILSLIGMRGFSIPPHIPAHKIVLLYIIQNKMQDKDPIMLASLAALLFSSYQPILEAFKFIKEVIKNMTAKFKEFFPSFISHECSGCVMCQWFSPPDSGYRPVMDDGAGPSRPTRFQAHMNLLRNRATVPTPAPAVEDQNLDQSDDAEVSDRSGMLCWIYTLWDKLNAKAAGLLATALLMAMGLKSEITTFSKNIGAGVIGTLKNFHWISLGLGAVPNILKIMLSAIGTCVDTFRKWINPDHETHADLIDRAHKWLERAALCQRGFIEPAYLQNDKVGVFYQHVKTEGLYLQTKIHHFPIELRSVFRYTWEQVLKISTTMDSLIKFSMGRFEPVHWQFCGPPNIGKSNIATQLINKYGMSWFGTKEAYQVNDTLDYFDLLRDHEIAIWDEMYQDPEDSKAVLRNFILSGGNLVVPMADLENKGRTVTFKAIFSTTNTPYPISRGVMDNQSVLRRRRLIRVREVGPDEPTSEEVTGTSNVKLCRMRFDVMNPLHPEPLDPALTDLTWGEICEYIDFVTRDHITIERNRSIDAGTFDLRARYQEFKNTWNRLIAGSIPPDNVRWRRINEHYLEVFDSIDHAFSPQGTVQAEIFQRDAAPFLMNPVMDDGSQPPEVFRRRLLDSLRAEGIPRIPPDEFIDDPAVPPARTSSPLFGNDGDDNHSIPGVREDSSRSPTGSVVWYDTRATPSMPPPYTPRGPIVEVPSGTGETIMPGAEELYRYDYLRAYQAGQGIDETYAGHPAWHSYSPETSDDDYFKINLWGIQNVTFYGEWMERFLQVIPREVPDNVLLEITELMGRTYRLPVGFESWTSDGSILWNHIECTTPVTAVPPLQPRRLVLMTEAEVESTFIPRPIVLPDTRSYFYRFKNMPNAPFREVPYVLTPPNPQYHSIMYKVVRHTMDRPMSIDDFIIASDQELTPAQLVSFESILMMSMESGNSMSLVRLSFMGHAMEEYYQNARMTFMEGVMTIRERAASSVNSAFRWLTSHLPRFETVAATILVVTYTLYIFLLCHCIKAIFSAPTPVAGYVSVPQRTIGSLTKVRPVDSFEGVECRETQVQTLATKFNYLFSYKALSIVDGVTDYQRRDFNAIGIQGNLFLCPYHAFVGNMEDNITLNILDNLSFKVNNMVVHTTSISISNDIYRIPDTDACIVRVKTFRCVSTSIHQFVKEEDLVRDKLVGVEATVYGMKALNRKVPFEESGYVLQAMDLRHFRAVSGVACSYKNCFGIFDNKRGYVTSMSANAITPGHSGCIVSHSNSKIRYPFLGIVGAADLTTTIVIPITQEMLIQGIASFSKFDSILVEEPDMLPPSKDSMYNGVPVVGTFLPKQQGSPHTTLRKTIFYPSIPSDEKTHEPAILSEHDKRWDKSLGHFLSKGVSKYSGPDCTVDVDKVFRAAAEIGQYYANFMPDARLQTIEESIFGSGTIGSKALNVQTGAGLPWSLMSPKKGKTGFICLDPPYVDPRVITETQDMLDKCANGVYPPSFQVMFPKDELLPSDKIFVEPKTRTITMAPMHTLVANGVLTGDIVRYIKNMRIEDSRIASGYDFETLQTHNLVEYWNFHDTMLFFDVKGWDGCMSSTLALAYAECIYTIYKYAYASRNEVLPENLKISLYTFTIGQYMSYIVFRDSVFFTRHGLKSGERDTLTKNSICHVVLDYLIYSYIIHHYAPELAFLDNVDSYMTIIKSTFLGDDSARGIHPDYAHIFTPSRYVEGYNYYGFDVTTAQKDYNFRFSNINEASFLQLTFHFDIVNSIWRARPSTKIIRNLLQWRSDTLPAEEQLRVNLLNACRVAYHQGFTYYQKFYAQLAVLCARHQFQWSIPNYESIGAWIGNGVFSFHVPSLL